MLPAIVGESRWAGPLLPLRTRGYSNHPSFVQ